MILDKPPPTVLTLTHGANRCDVVPAVGGSIGAWIVHGQEMMRAATLGGIEARDPYRMASFPLVPYSNRIADARFVWDGNIMSLAQNFPPEPHAIHGVGFQRAWQVVAHTRQSVELALNHRPDAGWPWAFEARQRITLADELLTLHLSAVNRHSRAVPLTFAHHPYFPRAGAQLEFNAEGVWLVGDDHLPSRWTKTAGAFDYSQGLSVENAEVDHCFTGWSGVARIGWPAKPWTLEITGSHQLRNAVVYIRRELDAFCFEPVVHINDALNRQADMPVIQPGESFTSSIVFRAVKR
jgi:aldose 1-epimerase